MSNLFIFLSDINDFLMNKILLTLFFQLLIISCYCQNKVINKDSKEPVSYACIRDISKQKVTLANYNGEFKLDSSYRLIDSIVISCVGYVQKTTTLKYLQQTKVIELTPINNIDK